jgi:hypothetical protein
MALTQIPSGMIAPAQTLTLNGVTFPATQVPSADANTLDDYEEGTWTPVLSADSGVTSGGTSSGRYTKVGRLVYINCVIGDVNKNTLSGNLRVTGLPFVTADANSNALLRYDWGTTVTGYVTAIPQAPVNSQQFDIQLFTTSGYAGQIQASNCGTLISIYSLTACYSV